MFSLNILQFMFCCGTPPTYLKDIGRWLALLDLRTFRTWLGWASRVLRLMVLGPWLDNNTWSENNYYLTRPSRSMAPPSPWSSSSSGAQTRLGLTSPMRCSRGPYTSLWLVNIIHSGVWFVNIIITRSVAQTNVEYGGYSPAATNVVWVHGSVDPWHAMGVIN